MNYSIHTFTLERYLRYEEFQNLKSHFYKDSNFRIYKSENNHNCIYINGYKGIRIILISLNHNFCKSNFLIQIIVNLKAISESDNITNLFDKKTESFYNLIEKLNKILFDINGYNIDNFIIKRIDLTLDLKFQKGSNLNFILEK